MSGVGIAGRARLWPNVCSRRSDIDAAAGRCRDSYAKTPGLRLLPSIRDSRGSNECDWGVAGALQQVVHSVLVRLARAGAREGRMSVPVLLRLLGL
jgi:hypothetical protein